MNMFSLSIYCHKVFPEGLYEFTFSLAENESSSCSTCSLPLAVVSLFHCSIQVGMHWGHTVVSTCPSLMTKVLKNLSWLIIHWPFGYLVL